MSINMDGLINFTGTLSGEIEDGGGSGVTPHVTADASVNDQTGVPGVTVVRSGPDAAPHFDFEFVNLKGADGAPGVQGPQGLTGATGPAGAQGPRGFTGATGATGPAGADGYSPAVTITDITGGHRVTITDETHPLGQNFDIMNGIDGQDGSPGQEGPQGPAGIGIPTGGTTGQYLRKAGPGDYLTEWATPAAAEVSIDVTNCQIVTSTDLQGAVEELDTELVSVNASLTQKVVTKNVSITTTANQHVSPFTNYAIYDLTAEEQALGTLISASSRGGSTNPVAFGFEPNGTRIFIYSGKAATFDITLIFIN